MLHWQPTNGRRRKGRPRTRWFLHSHRAEIWRNLFGTKQNIMHWQARLETSFCNGSRAAPLNAILDNDDAPPLATRQRSGNFEGGLESQQLDWHWQKLTALTQGKTHNSTRFGEPKTKHTKQNAESVVYYDTRPRNKVSYSTYRAVQKTDTLCFYGFFCALISSNIDRFANLFHCLNQENICSNTLAKDPTTPQVCRYTTLWNVSVLKATTENRTSSVTTNFKK